MKNWTQNAAQRNLEKTSLLMMKQDFPLESENSQECPPMLLLFIELDLPTSAVQPKEGRMNEWTNE